MVKGAPDVTVVGGGPAGSALAIVLGRRGVRVCLYEKCRHPRLKPCGEGLLPHGVTALEDIAGLPNAPRVRGLRFCTKDALGRRRLSRPVRSGGETRPIRRLALREGGFDAKCRGSPRDSVSGGAHGAARRCRWGSVDVSPSLAWALSDATQGRSFRPCRWHRWPRRARGGVLS